MSAGETRHFLELTSVSDKETRHFLERAGVSDRQTRPDRRRTGRDGCGGWRGLARRRRGGADCNLRPSLASIGQTETREISNRI